MLKYIASLLWLCSWTSWALTTESSWDIRWKSVCGANCGKGTRKLEVTCRQGLKLVEDSFCNITKRPKNTEPCVVQCVHVDPAVGSDKNLGTEDKPLRTLASCVTRAGIKKDDRAPVTRCVLAAGRYVEPPINLGGRHRLVIEPAAHLDKGAVIFDGTDPINVEWRQQANRGWIKTANLTSITQQLEALVVNGSALQSAQDFSTAVKPCFVYNGHAGEDAIPQPFACEDATRFFEIPIERDFSTDEIIRHQRALPNFWFDRHAGLLHVIDAESGPEPEVRVKSKSRHTAFIMGNGKGSEHVYLQGLHFFGTTIALKEPTSRKEYNNDIRVEHCRFTYHPAAVHLSTTGQKTPSMGQNIEFIGNILEFGEGTLSYKANAAKVSNNLIIGNSFASRGDFSVKSIALQNILESNTFLYNGDLGGHLVSGENTVARHNLWVGQSYLSRSHGSAVHKIKDNARASFLCENNWFLGPSLAASIGFDDSSKKTTSEHNTTIRHNVFLGYEPLTFKASNDRLIFEHNTGDTINIEHDGTQMRLTNRDVSNWTQNNTAPGLMRVTPRHTTMNVCANLSMCNMAKISLSNSVAQALSAHKIKGDVCQFLRRCHPEGKNVYEELRAHIDGLRPPATKPLLYSQIRTLDFGPVEGGALLVKSKINQGMDYFGAYGGSTQNKAPGCWSTGCKRQNFQIPNPFTHSSGVVVTTTTHPLAPGPDEIATKSMQCDTLENKQFCNGPNTRELGTMVESGALCRSLCEVSGHAEFTCCSLTKNFRNEFVCREFLPPYAILVGDPLQYAGTCKMVITGAVPKDHLVKPTSIDEKTNKTKTAKAKKNRFAKHVKNSMAKKREKKMKKKMKKREKKKMAQKSSAFLAPESES